MKLLFYYYQTKTIRISKKLTMSELEVELALTGNLTLMIIFSLIKCGCAR